MFKKVTHAKARVLLNISFGCLVKKVTRKPSKPYQILVLKFFSYKKESTQWVFIQHISVDVTFLNYILIFPENGHFLIFI